MLDSRSSADQSIRMCLVPSRTWNSGPLYIGFFRREQQPVGVFCSCRGLGVRTLRVCAVVVAPVCVCACLMQVISHMLP